MTSEVRPVLRLTAFPPGNGPYERWELTVEQTGEVLLQGDMPIDYEAISRTGRAFCDKHAVPR